MDIRIYGIPEILILRIHTSLYPYPLIIGTTAGYCQDKGVF